VSSFICGYDGRGTQKKKGNVHLNAEELRSQTVKRRKELKRSDDGYIPDHTWQWLQEEGFIEDALLQDFDEEAVDFIVRRIDQMYGRASYGGSRQSAGANEYDEESAPKVGEYVSARAKAISEFLAILADQRPDVTEFRRKSLGESLLAPEEARTILAASGTVVEEALKLGAHLAEDYLGWDEEGAVWYVLTGETPQLHPIKIRGRGKFRGGMRPFQHSVILTVLPWVPAKEVERVYRNVQQQVLEEASRETGPRILEVAQFVWERLRLDGERKSWQAWFRQWNENYPEKKFETWRNFREYCARGYKEALPNYKFAEPKARPEVKAAYDKFMQRLKASLSRAELIEITDTPQREGT
jgi:hypothetical protein